MPPIFGTTRLSSACQLMLFCLALPIWYWAIYHFAMHSGHLWFYWADDACRLWRHAFLSLACFGVANFACMLAFSLFSEGLYRWGAGHARACVRV
jgi:hypothetical protein